MKIYNEILEGINVAVAKTRASRKNNCVKTFYDNLNKGFNFIKNYRTMYGTEK